MQNASITLCINQHDYVVNVGGNDLLVSVLRDSIGLTGTHIGCDTSQCGACLVLVDDKLIKSCAMFAWEAQNKSVMTIEDTKNKALDIIRQAFCECHGLQCGFCTPGMVMSAFALLSEITTPTEAEIKAWLEGNICRCTGYHNIVRSIQKAAANLKQAQLDLTPQHVQGK